MCIRERFALQHNQSKPYVSCGLTTAALTVPAAKVPLDAHGPAHLLFPKPVILTIHVKDSGIMDQSADQGCRHMFIIAEECDPFRKLKV